MVKIPLALLIGMVSIWFITPLDWNTISAANDLGFGGEGTNAPATNPAPATAQAATATSPAPESQHNLWLEPKDETTFQTWLKNNPDQAPLLKNYDLRQQWMDELGDTNKLSKPLTLDTDKYAKPNHPEYDATKAIRVVPTAEDFAANAEYQKKNGYAITDWNNPPPPQTVTFGEGSSPQVSLQNMPQIMIKGKKYPLRQLPNGSFYEDQTR